MVHFLEGLSKQGLGDPGRLEMRESMLTIEIVLWIPPLHPVKPDEVRPGIQRTIIGRPVAAANRRAPTLRSGWGEQEKRDELP